MAIKLILPEFMGMGLIAVDTYEKNTKCSPSTQFSTHPRVPAKLTFHHNFQRRFRFRLRLSFRPDHLGHGVVLHHCPNPTTQP